LRPHDDSRPAIRVGVDGTDRAKRIFSPSTGTQLLERGGIDQVDVHVLPRLLGDGTRLYDVAGESTRKLLNLGRR
jgi:hypothetical protein